MPFIVLKCIVFVVCVLNVLSVTVANQFTVDKIGISWKNSRCFFAAFSHLKFGDERDDQNYDEAYVNAVLSFSYEIKKVWVFAFKVLVNFKIYWFQKHLFLCFGKQIYKKIFPSEFLNSKKDKVVFVSN